MWKWQISCTLRNLPSPMSIQHNLSPSRTYAKDKFYKNAVCLITRRTYRRIIPLENDIYRNSIMLRKWCAEYAALKDTKMLLPSWLLIIPQLSTLSNQCNHIQTEPRFVCRSRRLVQVDDKYKEFEEIDFANSVFPLNGKISNVIVQSAGQTNQTAALSYHQNPDSTLKLKFFGFRLLLLLMDLFMGSSTLSL